MKSKYRYIIASITLILIVIGVALYSAFTYSVNENDYTELLGYVRDNAVEKVDTYERMFATKGEGISPYITCNDEETSCQLKEIPDDRRQEGPTCWAISATHALEATLANKIGDTAYGKTKRINPYHMVHMLEREVKEEVNYYGIRDQKATEHEVTYEEGYTAIVGNGGSILTPILFFTNGTGFTIDSSFHFNAQNNNSGIFYQAYTLNELLNAQKEEYTITNIQYINGINVNANQISPDNTNIINRINDVKELIREGIGVQITSYGFDGSICTNNINNNVNVYCPLNMIQQYNPGGHAITVVGWDDDYAVVNFAEGNQPPAPGAWIIRNSWGNNKNYYLSYYDYGSIKDEMIAYTDAAIKNYDNLYQYNPAGCISKNEGCTGFKSISKEAIIIYDKINKNKKEKLTNISFYADKKGQNTNIGIYLKQVDNSNEYSSIFDDGNYIDTVDIPASGYYTYNLEEPITIEHRKFIIGLRASQSAVLKAQPKANKKMGNIELDIKPGYSYQIINNEWVDTVLDTNTKGTNFIKAFTINDDNENYTYVEPIHVQGITISHEELEIDTNTVGTQLEYEITPNNAEYQYVEWTSSDNTVVTVDNDGVLTPHKPGTATITVKTIDGNYTDECNVTVQAGEAPLTNVSIDRGVTGIANNPNPPIKVNQKITLKPKYTPKYPSNVKSVDWSISSNDYIEIVSQNNNEIQIIGIAEGGQTTITLTVTDTNNTEFTDTIDITVEGFLALAPEEIVLPETIAVRVGETYQIEYSCIPEDSDCRVTWEISNEHAATIDENGLLTALAIVGRNILITARSKKDPTITATSILIVRPEGTPPPQPNVVTPNISISDITYNGSTNINHSNITVSNLASNQYTILSATLSNTDVGERQASVTLRLTDENYIFDNGEQEKTFTVNVNIIKASLPIVDNTQNVTLNYDGNNHNLIANIQNNSNQTLIIKYKNLGGTYNLNEPMYYQEPGTYTYYYKVSINNNYEEYYGERTLTILESQEPQTPYIINNYNVDETNHYITNITIYTEASSFIPNITLGEGYTAEVDTKLVDNKNVLYTGGKTRIMHNSSVYAEYTNIVISDVNGNGKTDVIDYIRIMKDIMNVSKLTDVYKLAADVNNNGRIDVIDYIRIMKRIMGEM